MQCSITVITSITSLSVSPTSSTLESGQTLQLNKTINPSTATEGVQWASSNTSVATVSNSGLITAKNSGTATITLKNSSGTRYASCSITVIKKYKSSEINKIFYGKLVTNYQGPRDGGMKYRIFYADGTNVYLITDDYQENGAYIYSDGYLKNKSEWNYLNKGEFADYAQGAPTLEMYLSSYNQTHGTNITEENTGMGYSFLILNGDRVIKYEIPAIEDYNGIYLKLDKSKARAMSLASAASPEEIWAVGTFNEFFEELVGFKWTHCTGVEGIGIRPIICLNSSVKFQKNSDGSYTLSY